MTLRPPFLLAFLLLLTCWQAPIPAVADGYSHVDLARAEELMFTQVNAIRASRGLTLLQAEPALDQVADHHARDMVMRNYFAHLTPEGDGPQERLGAAGLPYPVGENLGAIRSFGLDTEEIVAGLMQALMDSPPHRANILNPRVTHLGLGFCQDKDDQSAFMDLDLAGRPGAGTVVVCQEFVRKPLRQWTPLGSPEVLAPSESVRLTGEPSAHFAAVAVEIVDRANGELVRYSHLPLVEGSFATDLRLEQPGRYEVRVLGLRADALLQTPEPLGIFLFTVDDGRKRMDLEPVWAALSGDTLPPDGLF